MAHNKFYYDFTTNFIIQNFNADQFPICPTLQEIDDFHCTIKRVLSECIDCSSIVSVGAVRTLNGDIKLNIKFSNSIQPQCFYQFQHIKKDYISKRIQLIPFILVSVRCCIQNASGRWAKQLSNLRSIFWEILSTR